MPVLRRPWLALVTALSLASGAALRAQDPEDPGAPAPVAPTLPPRAAPRGEAAAVVSARDPFHSPALAPPAPPGQQAARGAPQAIKLLGTIRLPGRPSCAVVQLADATFVVRAGDRVPLVLGSQLQAEEYLEVRAVEDGWLEVESGRATWVLR